MAGRCPRPSLPWRQTASTPEPESGNPGLKAREVSCWVWGQHPRSRAQRSGSLWRPREWGRGGAPLPLPSDVALILGCGRLTPISTSVFTQLPPGSLCANVPCKHTGFAGFGVHLNPLRPSLNSITSAKTHFQIRSQHRLRLARDWGHSSTGQAQPLRPAPWGPCTLSGL